MITETISDVLELTSKLMELHNENPFKRASNFATLGYESLDSDLLPKKGEDNV